MDVRNGYDWVLGHHDDRSDLGLRLLQAQKWSILETILKTFRAIAWSATGATRR